MDRHFVSSGPRAPKPAENLTETDEWYTGPPAHIHTVLMTENVLFGRPVKFLRLPLSPGPGHRKLRILLLFLS